MPEVSAELLTNIRSRPGVCERLNNFLSLYNANIRHGHGRWIYTASACFGSVISMHVVMLEDNNLVG